MFRTCEFTILAYGTNFAPNKQPVAEALSELGKFGGRGLCGGDWSVGPPLWLPVEQNSGLPSVPYFKVQYRILAHVPSVPYGTLIVPFFEQY